jgi:hypothetical protein
MNPITADVISVKGDKSYSRGIAWFTQIGKEGPTYATHIAMIIMVNGEPHVIESLWRVKITPYKKWEKEHDRFAIFRNTNLTNEKRALIQEEALKYKGRFYGFSKILLNGLDLSISKIIGKEIFLFRKLQFIDRYPICNWLVSYSYYNATGYTFGCEPKLTNPDSMTDYMRKDKNFVLKLIKFCKGGILCKK